MKDSSISDEIIPLTHFPSTCETVNHYLRSTNQVPPVSPGRSLIKTAVDSTLSFMKRLGWNQAYALGTMIGKGMAAVRLRKDVAMVNLDIAFGDSKTRAEKEEIYRQSMLNVGRLLINYLRLPFQNEAFWKECCSFADEKNLADAMNKNKGVLVISGHLGLWDLAAGKLGMAGYPISVVAKDIINPVINNRLIKARLSMNLGTIATRRTMEKILHKVRNGEAVAMTLDQNMRRNRGVFIDWMGKKASSVRSGAWVVRETGCPVIAGFMIQKGPKEFELVMSKEIPWISCPGNEEEEILANIQNQSDAIQKLILKYPEHWFWIHRRYKLRPEGEEKVYTS